jgi:hypothetical protein
LVVSTPERSEELRVEHWKWKLAELKFKSCPQTWFHPKVKVFKDKKPIESLPRLPQRAQRVFKKILEVLLRVHLSVVNPQVEGIWRSGRDLLQWRSRPKQTGKKKKGALIRINPLQIRDIRTSTPADLPIMEKVPSVIYFRRVLEQAQAPILELGRDWLDYSNKILEVVYRVFFQIRRDTNARFDFIRSETGGTPEATFRVLNDEVVRRKLFLDERQYIAIGAIPGSGPDRSDSESEEASFPPLGSVADA